MSQPKFSIDLPLARIPKSPQLFFQECSVFCDSKGLTQVSWDMYGDYQLNQESSWLRRFESDVAIRLGKEDAIFLMSGVMAQNMIAEIHYHTRQTDCSKRFICHYSSHLLIHEKDAYSHLLHMEAVIVPRKDSVFQTYLSYDDVATLLDSEPKPFMLLIECPHREIGGKITPWEDLMKMSDHCRRRGIAFHCDGARLWEAEAAYTQAGQRSFQEFCSMFDSIYVSFYKGLGAVTGAMLLGSNSDIADARVWSRRFGGNVLRYLPYAVSCWKAFEENPPIQFVERRDRLRQVVALLTTESTVNFESVLEFDPPVPEVSMVHVYLRADVASSTIARDHAKDETGVLCFFTVRPVTHEGHGGSYFEMNMVSEFHSDDLILESRMVPQ